MTSGCDCISDGIWRVACAGEEDDRGRHRVRQEQSRHGEASLINLLVAKRNIQTINLNLLEGVVILPTVVSQANSKIWQVLRRVA